MKKIKILALLVTMLTVTFYSCTDNNSIEEEVVVTQKSMSLRTTLNEIKKSANIAGKSASTNELCFDFVYPLNLSYNNGTTVEVASYDALISLLESETEGLYVEGVSFPFDVISNGAQITINNEDEFMALIEDCDFYTVDEDVYIASCFDLVYPYSVINQDNQVTVINSEEDLFNLFANPNSENYIVDFVYPVSVSQNNQTITINNMYEFFDIIDACEPSTGGGENCNCSDEFAPVCINVGNGEVIQYANICLAECDGYTIADAVDCGNYDDDGIDGMGECFNFVYPLSIQSQGANITVNSDDELLNSSPVNSEMIFNYPIQITFTSSGTTVTVNNETEFGTQIAQNCN